MLSELKDILVAGYVAGRITSDASVDRHQDGNSLFHLGVNLNYAMNVNQIRSVTLRITHR